MRRWRTFAGCAIGVVAASLLPSATSAQDDGLAADISALVPDDADDLGTDEIGALLDSLLTLIDDESAGGDGSSSLTGPCGGFAFSFDDAGVLLDAAYDVGDDAPPQDLLDGGQAFTDGNPFRVDTGGKVTYVGFAPRTGEGPTDHDYALEVAGFTIASGGDPNVNEKNRAAGTIDVGDELPVDLSVAFTVSGSFEAPEFAGCVGEGHVEFDGAGLFGPIGLVGLGATAVGLVGLFVSRPARTWRQP